MAYRENGQLDDALGDLNALIEDWDDWFRPYYERAMTYKAMGGEEEALVDLRQAWEYVDNDEWRARIELEMESLGTKGAE
jgi:hypothetical protein